MSETSETMKSSVWDYFKKCNDESNKARCLLCHKIFSCSTSANLRHHLKCIHFNEVDLANMEIKHRRIRENGPRSTRELIRKSFSKVEGDKLAMCNICHKILSYRTTIANLKNHLIRIHNDEYSELIEELKTASDNEEETTEETYFEEVDDDNVSVSFNKKTDDRKLKRNFSNLHDGDVYTEVIYLEDDEQTPRPKYKTKTTYSNEFKKQVRNKRTPSIMSSHEEFNYLLENKTDNNEIFKNELEKFGQYIACLLGSLPKHVSTKLQMNIFNQIMEEKLKNESSSNIVAETQTVDENQFNNFECKNSQAIIDST